MRTGFIIWSLDGWSFSISLSAISLDLQRAVSWISLDLQRADVSLIIAGGVCRWRLQVCATPYCLLLFHLGDIYLSLPPIYLSVLPPFSLLIIGIDPLFLYHILNPTFSLTVRLLSLPLSSPIFLLVARLVERRLQPLAAQSFLVARADFRRARAAWVINFSLSLSLSPALCICLQFPSLVRETSVLNFLVMGIAWWGLWPLKILFFF